MTQKKIRGQPPFIPTRRQRAAVSLLAGGKMSFDEIAQTIINPQTEKPISRDTLMKAFAQELEVGRAMLKAKALRKLDEAVEEGQQWAVMAVLKHVNGYNDQALININTNTEPIDFIIRGVEPTKWESEPQVTKWSPPLLEHRRPKPEFDLHPEPEIGINSQSGHNSDKPAEGSPHEAQQSRSRYYAHGEGSRQPPDQPQRSSQPTPQSTLQPDPYHIDNYDAKFYNKLTPDSFPYRKKHWMGR
jgi:hypothetical protein